MILGPTELFQNSFRQKNKTSLSFDYTYSSAMTFESSVLKETLVQLSLAGNELCHILIYRSDIAWIPQTDFLNH